MDQLILTPDKSKLAYVDFEIETLPEDKPWNQIPNEPDESHALLMILINDVPKKTVSALHELLKSKNMDTMSLKELKECARKFQWMERAWAYERNIGESIKNKREEKLDKITEQYDEMLENIVQLNMKMQQTKDPALVVTEFAGLIASAKVNLPTQISNMLKTRIGDKVKMEVEGKFDHRCAVAIAQFAKDT